MSTQERIQDLCQRALRTGAWNDTCRENTEVRRTPCWDEETVVVAPVPAFRTALEIDEPVIILR